MKLHTALFTAFALVLAFTPVQAELSYDFEFVESVQDRFENVSDSNHAWSKFYAIGIGRHNESEAGTGLTWVAYSNSDGLMQFEFNLQLPPADLDALDRVIDRRKRNWETRIPAPGGRTWLGTTNDWVDLCVEDDAYRRETGLTCTAGDILKPILDKLEETSVFTDLKVEDYPFKRTERSE
jgi:hypothetical protein